MELAELLRHDLPVLMVGHAEPLVRGVKDGHLQRALLQLIPHHHRQQALGLDIFPGLRAKEVFKVLPQGGEDAGGKPPEVHGHHRLRGQVRALRQIPQRAVGIQLDLQCLPDGAELSVLHRAHAAGHRAVEAGGILQQIPHHGGLSRLRQLHQLVIDGAVGVDAVIVVGIDDAEGLMHHIRRAQQGMDRPEGLGPLRRNPVEVRHGGKVLKDIGHLHRRAVQCGLPRQIVPAQAAHHLLHLRLDDEHHLAEPRPEGVVDGVLHQDLVVGPDAVHLLAAAVAGPKARRHDDQ